MMLDLLEPRRFLAVDLTGSLTLNAQAPYYLSPSPGADLSLTIRNDGSTNADLPIVVTVYLSKNRKYEASVDERIADFTLPSLAAGGSTTITDQLNAGGATPGKYYLITVFDETQLYIGQGNPFAESNRDNNTLITSTQDVVIAEQWFAGLRDGTAAKDVFSIQQNETHQLITINGELFATGIGEIAFYQFLLGASADKFTADPDVTTAVRVSGGGGNDTLIGGAGIDEFSGSGGRDRIFGQGGDDYLIGGGANDYLEGGTGDDTMSGGLGNDKLVALSGADSVLGGAGNDQFFTKGDGIDTLSGGPGTDLGDFDANDLRAGIEGII